MPRQSHLKQVKYRHGCKIGSIALLQHSMLVRCCLKDLVSQFLAKPGKRMGCTIRFFFNATTSKSMSRSTRTIKATKIPAASVFLRKIFDTKSQLVSIKRV